MFHRACKIYLAVSLIILFGSASAQAAWTLQPSLGLKEVYDSNPDLKPESAGVDGLFKSTVTPALSLVNVGKSYNLTGSYTLNTTYHHDRPALDYEAHTAALSARLDVGKRSSISISDNYSLNKGASLTDAGVGVHLSRSTIKYNTLSLGLSTEYGKYWSFSLTATDSRTEYDDPTLIDSVTDIATLDSDYELNKTTDITSTYTFSRYNFDSSGVKSAREVHNLSIGVNREISPTLTGSLSGGILYSNNFSSDFDWSLGAKLNKSTDKYDASIDYSRNVNDSSGLDNEVVINNTVSLSGKYRYKQSLTLNAGSTFSHIRSEPGEAVDLETLSTEVGAEWKLNSKLNLALNISRYNQWVDKSTASSLLRDQVYIGLTYTPNEWRL